MTATTSGPAATSHNGDIAPYGLLATGGIVTLLLLVLSQLNFLWFHTLAEGFSITVGISLYLIASSSFHFTRNSFLLFLAQGFFWASCLDAIHTLSYSGMGLLPDDNPNPATQLWLCARVLEAGVLLHAPYFLARRKVPKSAFVLLGSFAVATALLIYTDHFPAAYVPLQGLTPFKVYGEYFIVLLLALAGIRMYLHRVELAPELYYTVQAVIVLIAISEFAFTLYVHVYGISNLIGHIAKFWAFALLLMAISRWMLARPFNILARDASSFENIPMPVLLLDVDGTVQSCNRSARDAIVGGGVGEPVHQVWHPPELTAQECPVCQAIAEGKPIQLELHDETHHRWSVVSLQPLGGDAILHGFVCVQEDITARKQTEAARRATEARLSTILDNAPDGVFLVNKEGRFTYVNKQAEALVGYDREVLLQMAIPDITPQESLELAETTLHQTLIEGHGRVELEILRSDGQRLPVEVTGVLLPDGNVYGAMRDISERMLAAKKLMQQGALLRRIIDSIPDLIFYKDKDSNYLGCNKAFETYFGHSEADIVGKADFDFVDRKTAEIFRENDRVMLEQGNSRVNEEWIRYPDGKQALMETLKTPYYDDDNTLLGLIGISRDITQRRQVEEKARASERRFRALFEHMLEGFAHCRMIYRDGEAVDFIYLDVNDKFEELTGLKDVVGKKVSSVIPGMRESNPELFERYARVASTAVPERFETYIEELEKWFYLSVYSFEPGHFVAVFDNITDRKNYEVQLEHQANYDALTGLANRNLLVDRLEQSIVYARRASRQVAVMLIDLDRFKLVNDGIGHEAGDRLLQQVAERLRQCVRPGDTVSRISGDEFVVVLADMASESDALHMIHKLLSTVEHPLQVEGREVIVTASLGVTLYPRDGDTPAALIKNADIAMYRAKELGRNSYRFYSPEMNARVLGILDLQVQLSRALELGQMQVYYQPQVGLLQSQMVGAEALIRWQHPEKGLIAPSEFIPLAEETGLIVQLGEWVIDNVCARIHEWEKRGLSPVPIAVNVSARQFQDKNLVDVVKDALRKHSVHPERLELEVTESVVMDDPERTVAILRELKRIGISISLDDFGTGYSSLSYLKRFPIDQLKIDQSFVRDVIVDPDDAAIALSVISLAHSLKRQVIAEGVEDEAQLNFLKRHGCDRVQGYYFSRPMPAEQFTELLASDQPFGRILSLEDEAPRTVLLVDDEATILTSIEHTLRQDGYRVLKAESGDEALKHLAMNDVQVVVSDHRMPKMTGIELLSRVKEIYPDTVRILLTAYSDLDTVTEAVNRGAIFKFITKPWEERDIREHVAEAFHYYQSISRTHY